MQFETISETGEFPVAQLFKHTNEMPGANYLASVDCLQIWSASAKSFKNYYLRTDVGWVATDQQDVTKPTTDTVKAGDGVYFKRPGKSDTELTISGQVNVTNPSTIIQITKGTTKCMTYPYPIDFKIKDLIKYINSPIYGANYLASVDCIQKWSPTGKAYVNYYCRTEVGWVASNQEDKTVPTEDVISAGESIMFKRPGKSDATFTFPKPDGL